MVTVVFKIHRRVLRLRLIQPEEGNAFVEIIFLAGVKNEFLRFRIGRVKETFRAEAVHGKVDAVVNTHQQVMLLHVFVVLALFIDRRPDRGHQVHAHGIQLFDHSFRVRPELLVEFPVALMRPVEEVHNDDIHRDAAFMIFTSNLQQLILRLVTELALPEASTIIRHHGNGTGYFRVVFLNLRRSVTRGDPVIDLFRGTDLPLGQVFAEIRRADRRVVPEEAVTLAGKQERNARLGVALRHLKQAAFQVEVGVLVLTHAEQFFVRIGFKGHGDLKVIARRAFVLTRTAFQVGDGVEVFGVIHTMVPATVKLIEQQLVFVVEKAHPSVRAHLQTDLAVFHSRALFGHGDLSLRVSRHGQRPVFVRKGLVLGCTHTQTIAPRHDPDGLITVFEEQRTVLHLEKFFHAVSLPNHGRAGSAAAPSIPVL